MKLRYKGNGKIVIQGIAREFHDGDTIDLPKEVAEDLMKVNRFFEEVKESRIESKVLKIKED